MISLKANYAWLAILWLSASGGPSWAEPQHSIEELKAVYLECEERVSDAQLPAPDTMGCSVAYEELKQRAFGGDFGRLRAWWMAERGKSAVEGAAKRDVAPVEQ